MIPYTTDGSTPNEFSPRFLPSSSPITISADTTLKFAVWRHGCELDVKTEVYTIITNPASIGVTPAPPVDFGSINVGSSSAAQTFTVSNGGNSDLNVEGISTDNPEFSISNDTCSNQTMPPAGNCTLQVTFTPSTYGTRIATLSIPSNDPDTPIFSITLNGTGEASNIGVLPASPVDFGSVNVGASSAAMTFTVTNTGNIALAVGEIRSDNLDFGITYDNCSGKTIGPSGTCTLQVTFTPLSYGSMSAALSFPSNAPDTPIFSITLNGTGEASNIGVLPASPVDFGSVNVGLSSAEHTFTVGNTGNIPLTVGLISSSNSTEFVISDDTCSNQSIAPASSCALDVVFTPTGSGTRTSTLGIPSNDPDSSYVTVALSGTGVQYALTVQGAAGNATGSVAGATAINCSIAANGATAGTCFDMINPGATVTLTATLPRQEHK